MQVTINVPDGSPMATEITGWQDGATYDFTATQTAPNIFDATYAGPAEAVDEAVEEAPAPLHQNPAIARAMNKGIK